MAITTITNSMVSVNAIQGTLIADNAITAVHIASNAVASIQIAENNVTARELAANTITVAQLADDCVEADKIADGVITTNHLNKAMISSQTEVTPVAGDFVLLGDTSDSNNLKKAPLTLLLNSNVDLSTKLNLSGGTMTGDITLGDNDKVIFGAGSDLELFSDGTHATIRNHTDSGNLTLRTHTNFLVQTNASGGGAENAILAERNGAVKLYYDNNLVFSTESGAARISSHGTGGNLNLFSDSGTNEGQFNITYLTDGSSAAHSVAEIRMEQPSGSGSARTGQMSFRVSNSGAPSTAMLIDSIGRVGINRTPGLTSSKLEVGGADNYPLINVEASGNTAGFGIGSNKFKVYYGTTEIGGWANTGRFNSGNIYLNGESSNSQIEAGNVHFKVGAGIWMSGSSSLDLQMQVPVSGQGIVTAAKLDAPSGDWYTNDGTVSNLSDSRLKKEITTLSDGINIVKQLRPVTYKYDDTTLLEDGSKSLASASDTIRYGFVAQEVEAVASHYVTTREGKVKGETVSDLKSTSMTRMIPMLVKAIQELEAEVQALKG